MFWNEAEYDIGGRINWLVVVDFCENNEYEILELKFLVFSKKSSQNFQ